MPWEDGVAGVARRAMLADVSLCFCAYGSAQQIGVTYATIGSKAARGHLGRQLLAYVKQGLDSAKQG